MSAVATWLGSGAAATVMSSSIGAACWKLVKRAAKDAVQTFVDDIRRDVGDVQVKLAKETGGNSNGLRQKVDEVGKDVTGVKVDVAKLAGKVDALVAGQGVTQILPAPVLQVSNPPAAS